VVGRELPGGHRVAVVDGGDEAGAEGLEAAVLLFLLLFFGGKERGGKRKKKVRASSFLLFSGLAPLPLFLSPKKKETPSSSPGERVHVPGERPQPRGCVVGDVAQQVLDADILGLGRGNRGRHVGEDLPVATLARLADVVDGGVGRGRETVLLVVVVSRRRRRRRSRGRRGRSDAGRLADDEHRPRAKLSQEGVDREVVGAEPGARGVPADDALAGWRVCAYARVGVFEKRGGELKKKRERGEGVSRAIVVVAGRAKKNAKNSPLTLRNIPSIASAYEWSKNQIEGSRSSSSKGTK